jgi:hypothetical protein
MNRLGDDPGANPIGLGEDMTPRIVAGLLLGKTAITSIQTGTNGDIRFFLPLRPAKVSRADLLRMDMSRSNSLANFLGEFLVRRNPGRFETFVLRDDYAQQVKRCRHEHFGMWFEEPGGIRFQFHLSFLNQIFNDDISRLLGQESGENHGQDGTQRGSNYR